MSSKDPRYRKLITSPQWLGLRRWKLQSFPYCEECLKQGVRTPATCVHHIEPVEDCYNFRDMEERAYNPNNLQALCTDCHSAIHNAKDYHKKASVQARQKERTQRIIDGFFGPDDNPARSF